MFNVICHVCYVPAQVNLCKANRYTSMQMYIDILDVDVGIQWSVLRPRITQCMISLLNENENHRDLRINENLIVR